MLSEREKRWIWLGGLGAFCLLYLWLVLFPLWGYHQKMRLRVERSWGKLRRLTEELDMYVNKSGEIHTLIRRATMNGQKVPAEEQLKLLVQEVIKEKKIRFSLRFSPVWEGDNVALKRCFLNAKATPGQVFQLIQRIDRHYLPMRVVSWHMKRAGEGGYDLKMEIDLLEVVKRL
jgi:hypothetical protein